MGLNEILSKVNAGYVTAGIVVLLSLIQISPLKLNPWDKLLGWFGKKLNGGMEKQIKDLQKQVRDLWINNHRQSILTFARECRAEIEHSAEEWSHILNLCEEYERYCNTNDVTNGVVRQNTLYIRELYQRLSHEHRI
nr:hypothetical protein [Clostridia bacterium]